MCLAKHVQNVQKKKSLRAPAGRAHLMEGLHHAYHIVEDDDGLSLAQPLLLDDVMLEVDQVRRLVAEVVGAQAVEHQADPLFHLAHFVGLEVLHYFVGAILRRRAGWGLERWGEGRGQRKYSTG